MVRVVASLSGRGGSLDGDPPERRLRAVAPRRAEDRRREDLTDVFRLAWEHGVNGQAQVIKGMQQIIHSYTRLGDKEALSETVANVRWLIAAGIRDFQAMLDELAKLQTGLPRDAPAPDEPIHDDVGFRAGRACARHGAGLQGRDPNAVLRPRGRPARAAGVRRRRVRGAAGRARRGAE